MPSPFLAIRGGHRTNDSTGQEVYKETNPSGQNMTCERVETNRSSRPQQTTIHEWALEDFILYYKDVYIRENSIREKAYLPSRSLAIRGGHRTDDSTGQEVYKETNSSGQNMPCERVQNKKVIKATANNNT